MRSERGMEKSLNASVKSVGRGEVLQNWSVKVASLKKRPYSAEDFPSRGHPDSSGICTSHWIGSSFRNYFYRQGSGRKQTNGRVRFGDNLRTKLPLASELKFPESTLKISWSVAATGNFFATLVQVAKLHVSAEVIERKLQRRWHDWKRQQQAESVEHHFLGAEEAHSDVNSSRNPTTKKTQHSGNGNQRNLQKLKTVKNLKLPSLALKSRTCLLNGSCKFKICPDVFQLIPERLEICEPTTSRPAKS